MIKLISEGLFTDGSFQLSKVLEQTNDRLGKLGKHGKRAKLKQSKNSIVLQFSFEGKQHQKGINCSFTKGGIIEAEKIAGLVTSQLSACKDSGQGGLTSVTSKADYHNYGKRPAAKVRP
jgi:hypothetical protein